MTVYTRLIIQCDRPMCPERYEHFGNSVSTARLNAFDNEGFVQRGGRDYCKNHDIGMDAAEVHARTAHT